MVLASCDWTIPDSCFALPAATNAFGFDIIANKSGYPSRGTKTIRGLIQLSKVSVYGGWQPGGDGAVGEEVNSIQEGARASNHEYRGSASWPQNIHPWGAIRYTTQIFGMSAHGPKRSVTISVV